MVGNVFNGMHVLIVDDNKRDRALVRRVLQAHGATHVIEASEPLEALEIVRHQKPDLLVTERHIEFVRFLRADKDRAIAEIPIVMISAKHRHSDVQEAHGSGIDEFVAKPSGTKRLLAHVLKALRDRRPFIRSELYFGPDRRRTPASALPVEPVSIGLGILSQDEIRVLLRG